MAITKDELDRFYEFACRRIEAGGEGLDLHDLVMEWESRNQRDEINAAIREGLDDIAAGRVRSAERVTNELEVRVGISK